MFKPLFENIEVDEDIVKTFASSNINVFNKSDHFFTYICFLYSKDGKDVPLSDRLKLYFQNISLCDDNCTHGKIDLETFEVECICEINPNITDSNDYNNSNILDNPLSSRILGLFQSTNIAVVKCFKQAFEFHTFIKNFSGLTMIGLYFIQIILSINIIRRIKNIRSFIYSIIIRLSFPPKKIKTINQAKLQYLKRNNIYEQNYKSKKIIIHNSKEFNEMEVQNNNEKKKNFVKISRGTSFRIETDNNSKRKKLFTENDSSFNNISNNNRSNNSSKTICQSEMGAKVFIKKKKINKFNKGKSNRAFGNDDLIEKSNRGMLSNDDEEKKSNNSYFKQKMEYICDDYLENKEGIKVYDIDKFKQQIKKQMYPEISEQIKLEQIIKKEKEQRFLHYEYKEYDENEINELEFEKAIIHDKRNCCQMFWYTLKQKQLIINTFFVEDQLKPFSIKLLVLIFSFTCYFVINGFLYNEEYISQLLNNQERTVYEYIMDSFERIIYSSLAGGFISVIIGFLFDTDKKIEEVIEKEKKNKILLKGKISKIYRRNIIILIAFIVFQFIAMAFFTIYVFCFCYVYPNTQMDWYKSSLIVVGFVQSVSFLASFLISFARFLSLYCHWELCFKFNLFLEENF